MEGIVLRIVNVSFDCADPRPLAEFWSRALGYTAKDVGEHFAFLEPPTEGQPNLLFLKVPEARTTKNRVHVDLEGGDREAEVERLVGLGATRADVGQTGEESWHVLADPEGNEFCLLQRRLDPL